MAVKKFYVYADVVGGDDGVVAMYKELEKLPGYRHCGVQRPTPDDDDKLTWFDICATFLALVGAVAVGVVAPPFILDWIGLVFDYFGG